MPDPIVHNGVDPLDGAAYLAARQNIIKMDVKARLAHGPALQQKLAEACTALEASETEQIGDRRLAMKKVEAEIVALHDVNSLEEHKEYLSQQAADTERLMTERERAHYNSGRRTRGVGGVYDPLMHFIDGPDGAVPDGEAAMALLSASGVKETELTGDAGRDAIIEALGLPGIYDVSQGRLDYMSTSTDTPISVPVAPGITPDASRKSSRLLDALPMVAANALSVKSRRWNGGAPSGGGPVAEGAESAEIVPSTEIVDLNLDRVAGHWTWTTEMLIDAPGLMAELGEGVRDNLRYKLAMQVWNGNGTRPNLKGIVGNHFSDIKQHLVYTTAGNAGIDLTNWRPSVLRALGPAYNQGELPPPNLLCLNAQTYFDALAADIRANNNLDIPIAVADGAIRRIGPGGTPVIFDELVATPPTAAPTNNTFVGLLFNNTARLIAVRAARRFRSEVGTIDRQLIKSQRTMAIDGWFALDLRAPDTVTVLYMKSGSTQVAP